MLEQLLAIQIIPKDILLKRWHLSGSSSSTSLQYAVGVIDNTTYIFGGRVGLTVQGRSTTSKFKDGTYTAIRSLPKTLVNHCATVIGRKIYIMGGCMVLANGQENKQVIIYDVDTDQYTYGTDCPVAAIAAGIATVGADIYLYGGLANQSESDFPAQFHKYNTLNGVWTTLPWHDGPPLYHTFICNMGGLLYTFGGEYNNALSQDNTVRIFDPKSDTWSIPTVTGILPTPRGTSGVIYDENRFVIVGGRHIGTGQSSYANDCWIFDIDTNTWTQLTNYVSLIGFHRVSKMDNYLYVFDGFTGNVVWPGTYGLK